MKSVRIIIRFTLLLGFSYTLLALPWPGLRPTYAALFRAGNEFALGSFLPDRTVRFVPVETAGDNFDCRLIVSNRRKGATVETILSSDAGYAPAAFLTALFISTPLSFRRRAVPFLFGMTFLHAALSLILFLHITSLFGSNAHIATFSVSEFWQKMLSELTRFVLLTPFFGLVVPTFIWIVVTFRCEDIAMIARGPRECLPARRRAHPVGTAVS